MQDFSHQQYLSWLTEKDSFLSGRTTSSNLGAVTCRALATQRNIVFEHAVVREDGAAADDLESGIFFDGFLGCDLLGCLPGCPWK